MITEPLFQADAPTIRFCQKPDCSGLTMQIGTEGSFPFYNITSVTLNLTSGTLTSGVVDITSDIVSALTGTVTYSAMDHTITGGGTAFTTELSVGDYVAFSEYPWLLAQVYSITSDSAFETAGQMYYTSSGGNTAVLVNLNYDILPAFIGSSDDVIGDGNYSAEVVIEAVIDGSPQTFTITDEFTVICNNFCCLYQKLADLSDDCDNCMTDEYIKKVVDLMFTWGLLEANMCASYCGDTTSAAVLTQKLSDLCSSTPCKNC